MPKKKLTPVEFDNLRLPIKFNPKIHKACRYIFVDGFTFRKAASMSQIELTTEVEELYAAVAVVNQYLA